MSVPHTHSDIENEAHHCISGRARSDRGHHLRSTCEARGAAGDRRLALPRRRQLRRSGGERYLLRLHQGDGRHKWVSSVSFTIASPGSLPFTMHLPQPTSIPSSPPTTSQPPTPVSSVEGTTSRTRTSRLERRKRSTSLPTGEGGPAMASLCPVLLTSSVRPPPLTTWADNRADAAFRQPQRRRMLRFERVSDGLMDPRLLRHLPLPHWRLPR